MDLELEEEKDEDAEEIGVIEEAKADAQHEEEYEEE